MLQPNQSGATGSIVPLPHPIPVDFYLTQIPQDNPESVQEAMNELALSLGVFFDGTVDLTDVIVKGQLNGVLPIDDVGPWFNNSEWWFWNSTLGVYERGQESIPIGMVMLWGGTGTPANGNWLLCDGSEVLRDQYNKLFQEIGTTWGAGDGVTTFNLPTGAKMFGNSPGFAIDPTIPLDPGFGNRSGVGARGGSQVSPYLLPSNLPPIFMRVPFIFMNIEQNQALYGLPVLYPEGQGNQVYEYQLTDTVGAPLNALSQTVFSIMPPFAAANYIIKYQ